MKNQSINNIPQLCTQPLDSWAELASK